MLARPHKLLRHARQHIAQLQPHYPRDLRENLRFPGTPLPDRRRIARLAVLKKMAQETHNNAPFNTAPI